MVKKIENIVILVLAVAVIGLAYMQFGGQVGSVLSADDAADNAITFINDYMLEPGTEAELVGEVVKERGMYKFTIDLDGQEIASYITRDGTMLFPQGGIDLEEAQAEVAGDATESGELKTCEDIGVETQDEPVLEAFVVSYCPYGLQMQRVLNGIVKEAPELQKNMKIRYMGYVEEGVVMAMHGEEEAEENLRQICIREEQEDKFYPYLECFMKEGETEECLAESGVNEPSLQSCMTTPSKGVKYAEVDFALQDKYGVTGSPSLFLNGTKVSEFDFGGRTPEAVKTLLCCGAETEMQVCSEELSLEQSAVSFSEETTGGGSAASCE